MMKDLMCLKKASVKLVTVSHLLDMMGRWRGPMASKERAGVKGCRHSNSSHFPQRLEVKPDPSRRSLGETSPRDTSRQRGRHPCDTQ